MDSKQQSQDDSSISTDNESVAYLRDAIAKGKHWFIALLESIAMWTLSEENYKDRQHRYIIGGEAFDWLLLAERDGLKRRRQARRSCSFPPVWLRCPVYQKRLLVFRAVLTESRNEA